ncbi:MAG TPA: energy transducer TonB, partial [Melioribacteraceae bacterium]|nr:energy transducer TonB [Melioribacteraceae bacterium]
DALYELGQDYKGEYNNSMKQKGISKKDFEFYKKLVRFSLKFDMDEQGTTFLTLGNNQFIKKNFNSFLSDEIYNYYSQLINEKANPASRDAGLRIPEKELVDRMIKWENIYKSVKMDFAKEKAKDMFFIYFDNLFYGMDNTPTFDYVRNKLETGFKNAYFYLVNNYPSSVTSNIFKDYLNILKKNDFKKTSAIENFINNQTAKKITLISGSDITKNDESNKEEEVYFVAVEEQPEPIGGIQGIQSRIVYPEIAKRTGVQGRVFVKAFVNENGDVAKVELIKGVGAGCDEAAMDAVKQTKFKPGKQRGKSVKVQVAIPLVFK